ncbi:MAG: thymidylate synthase [Candidatus Nanoarchaeia archaeon]
MKSIHVVADTLPEAWEQSVIQTWQQGENFPTEYDKPEDPNSRDVSALIHTKHPFKEPRIHRAFPGGIEDLEKYTQEVIYGVHDHWIAPEEGKWEYTYHQRLRAYELPGHPPIDQISNVIEKLKKAGHTRRAQATTWQPWQDMDVNDPACLQRLWFRVQDGKLNMNCHIRSNDAFKAAFMNIYAFTELQRDIAEQVGVEPGEYIHMADSFHIYGSYFNDFKGFLNTLEQRTWEERTFTTEFAQPFLLEGRVELLNANLDNTEQDRSMRLRKKDQERIYKSLPDEYKAMVDERVKAVVNNT